MNTIRHKKYSSFGLASAVLLAAALSAGSASASSHREAPAIAEDPVADNTDVYAWVTPGTHEFLYVVANWNPLEEPSGGPNFHKFGDDVLYEVHIARGPDSLEDVVTYQIRFYSKRPTRIDRDDIAEEEGLFNGIQFFRQLSAEPPQQFYSVIQKMGRHRRVLIEDAPVAPPNIGPRTDAVVYQPESGTYDDDFAATFIRDLHGGGRVFAGPRDDGFYVDLGGAFDLANITWDRKKPVDGVSGFNVHSIVLEIPTKHLTETGKAPKAGPSDEQTLGVWASASRRKVSIRRKRRQVQLGPWVQVSRLGLPLVNEVLIGIQDKDLYNRSHPRDDLERFGPYFLFPTIVKNAEVVGIYDELEVGDDTVEALKRGPDGKGRFDIVDAINLRNYPHEGAHDIKTVGDVLRVDMGIDSAFPNGRPLVGGAAPNQEQADVTDVLLTLILSGGKIPISDNVQANDRDFLPKMPFLPLPFQGFNEGHGVAP
ncbi:MAG: DUF4331 domain-containing protein [Myxococcales bacterium]|nr:DUF4331 domain-containing protein [Myxococcales bacterium]MDD9970858.1 DUF4331 domain-containing protein [Myxococcales bacterium]